MEATIKSVENGWVLTVTDFTARTKHPTLTITPVDVKPTTFVYTTLSDVFNKLSELEKDPEIRIGFVTYGD